MVLLRCQMSPRAAPLRRVHSDKNKMNRDESRSAHYSATSFYVPKSEVEIGRKFPPLSGSSSPSPLSAQAPPPFGLLSIPASPSVRSFSLPLFLYSPSLCLIDCPVKMGWGSFVKNVDYPVKN